MKFIDSKLGRTHDFTETDERIVEDGEEDDSSSGEEPRGVLGHLEVDGSDNQRLKDGSDGRDHELGITTSIRSSCVEERFRTHGGELSHLHLESPDHTESDLHRVRDDVVRVLAQVLGTLGARTLAVRFELRGAVLLLLSGDGSEVGLAEVGRVEVLAELVGRLGDSSFESSANESSVGL